MSFFNNFYNPFLASDLYLLEKYYINSILNIKAITRHIYQRPHTIKKYFFSDIDVNVVLPTFVNSKFFYKAQKTLKSSSIKQDGSLGSVASIRLATLTSKSHFLPQKFVFLDSSLAPVASHFASQAKVMSINNFKTKSAAVIILNPVKGGFNCYGGGTVGFLSSKQLGLILLNSFLDKNKVRFMVLRVFLYKQLFISTKYYRNYLIFWLPIDFRAFTCYPIIKSFRFYKHEIKRSYSQSLAPYLNIAFACPRPSYFK